MSEGGAPSPEPLPPPRETLAATVRRGLVRSVLWGGADGVVMGLFYWLYFLGISGPSPFGPLALLLLVVRVASYGCVAMPITIVEVTCERRSMARHNTFLIAWATATAGWLAMSLSWSYVTGLWEQGGMPAGGIEGIATYLTEFRFDVIVVFGLIGSLPYPLVVLTRLQGRSLAAQFWTIALVTGILSTIGNVVASFGAPLQMMVWLIPGALSPALFIPLAWRWGDALDRKWFSS